MIGSGIGGSVGITAESTYGTYAASTRWWEANNAKFKKVKNPATSMGMAAGRQVPLGSRRVVTTKAGTGTMDIEVPTKGFGLALNLAIGGTVTPVQQAATTAYLQSHSLSSTQDNAGKMASVQVGVPDLTGTVRPYTYLGSKLTAIEFSCGIDEFLTAATTWDCRDLDEGQTLAAPSYTSGAKGFHFAQSSVKIGATTGAAAVVQGVRKCSLKIDRAMDTGRFYFGNAGLKSEPIINGFAGISGSLDTDFITKTDFADRYAADTQFALVWEFIGANIASTYYETFRITLPCCFFDDETPSLDGPDLVKPGMKFSVLNDGTNAPVLIEYMSTDITL